LTPVLISFSLHATTLQHYTILLHLGHALLAAVQHSYNMLN